MTTKEKIEEIDNILSSFEDVLHGEDGDNCTKARKLLSEIEVNNVILDDVIKCKNLDEDFSKALDEFAKKTRKNKPSKNF